MKNLFLTLFAFTLVLFGTNRLKACSPTHTPFNELLLKFDPKYNSAVEGYFISANTFKVTFSYNLSVKVGNEYKVFEYGPFGSSCEMYEMENNTDAKLIGADHKRLLFIYKALSKNGKLVTPIFHGDGVSIVNNETVTFEHFFYNEGSRSYKKYQFSTDLSAVKNWLNQKNLTKLVIWKKTPVS